MIVATKSGVAAPSLEALEDAPLLSVDGLKVEFTNGGQRTEAVKGLSYQICPGKTLAIVGESGSGKSVSCRALLGLVPHTATISGSARFDGHQLLTLSDQALRRHRGAGIAMVFQDAHRALNPTIRVGEQIVEGILAHEWIDRRAAKRRAADLVELLGLPAERLHAYPHQLSGGMRQRVMIAIAIAPRPRLLISDEPTSSLDVITQAAVMRLLDSLQERFGMALLLVSHDIRMVARFADDLLVMQKGRQLEYGRCRDVLADPQSDYTRALFNAIPGRSAISVCPPTSDTRAIDRCECAEPQNGTSDAALVANDIEQEFRTRTPAGLRWKSIRAVAGVSLEIGVGETLGLVGETGSGKSTLARTLLLAPAPKRGSVILHGEDITRLTRRAAANRLRDLQLVYQDPFGSLNPKWRVVDIVEEPLIAARMGDVRQRRRRTAEVLDLVALPKELWNRRPTQLSGGQCQRVAIARALAPNAKIIICDEAVSSLDALIRAEILTLFRRLQTELGLAFLFISHDFAVVREVCHRVAVIYRGRLCEVGPTESVYQSPRHPYTAALLKATGEFELQGPGGPTNLADSVTLPDITSGNTGCPFRARCERAEQRCADELPHMNSLGISHATACHFPLPDLWST